jgi:hypothetical protein
MLRRDGTSAWGARLSPLSHGERQSLLLGEADAGRLSRADAVSLLTAASEADAAVRRSLAAYAHLDRVVEHLRSIGMEVPGCALAEDEKAGLMAQMREDFPRRLDPETQDYGMGLPSVMFWRGAWRRGWVIDRAAPSLLLAPHQAAEIQRRLAAHGAVSDLADILPWAAFLFADRTAPASPADEAPGDRGL